MAKYDDFEKNWIQDPDLDPDPDLQSDLEPDPDPKLFFANASNNRVSCCALMENTENVKIR